MADGNKQPRRMDLFGGAIFGRFHPHAGHAGVVAQHFLYFVEPFQSNLARLGFLEEFVLQNFFGA